MMKLVRKVLVCARLTCVFLLAQAAAAAEFFVSLDGTHQPPFSDWGTAATNIQDAVDLAAAGSTVWVSNGVYQAGWRTNYPPGTVLKSRLVITNAVTVRSVDPDPANTVIKGSRDPDTLSNGSNAVRCVYLRGGASLIGFTVTNGATLVPPAEPALPDDNHNGGGIFVYDSGTASNCIIAGNLAGAYGAGIHKGAAFDCEIVGNRARTDSTQAKFGGGGGASSSILSGCRLANNLGHYGSASFYGAASNSCFTGNGSSIASYTTRLLNCLVVSNTSSYAVRGGMLYNSTIADNTGYGAYYIEVYLYNCIIYSNKLGNHYNVSRPMVYCCTTPAQTNWVAGDGNITANPLFLNRAAGNYRLPRNSPCVDAGTNGVWTADAVDLDNRRRIDKVTDIADMGCYEYVYPVRGTMCTFR